MKPYILYTDSGCDIPSSLLEEWGVLCCDLTYMFDDSEEVYTNKEMPAEEFYQKMREGHTAKTSAVNAETFRTCFEEELKKGNNILYLGFSSGLSTTYNCARLAAEELNAAYPEQKVVTVDTLAASAGMGMLVYFAVREKAKGAAMEDVAAYIEEIKWKLCHWFTVDDLVYLKRGGRVSAAAALLGGVLGIKPVLHVDNEGHLISRSKVRGRKAALQALADKMAEMAEDKVGGTVYISHGDCSEDAEILATMIKNTCGATVDLTVHVGPVIGAHSGPGTMALFFVGNER